MRQKLAAARPPSEPGRGTSEILAFLENELGLQALKRMDYPEAARRFEAAIELDPANPPAHLNLGDVQFLQGDVASGRWRPGSGSSSASPERAYLAFSRLENAYPQARRRADRFPTLCRRLIAANPQDWRARLALARHLRRKAAAREALELLFDALVQNPHALALHQAIWQTLSAAAAAAARSSTATSS